MNRNLRASLLVSIPLLFSQAVSAQSPSNDWSYTVTPYLWLPNLKADLRPGNTSTEIKPDSYLSNLDFAAMVAGTARKDRWVLGSDLIYLNFSDSESKAVAGGRRDASASVDITGWVWTAAGGYALVLEPKANVDVFAGFRYFALDTTLNTNVLVGRSVEQSANIWAAIVGIRGRTNLGDSKWFVNGYVDVGGGSSASTWQGIAGVGYAFDWGEVILDYRYLYYSQNNDKLIDNMSMGGLGIGANFHF